MSATDELRRLLDERGVEWRKPAEEYWVLLGMPEGDSTTIVGELSIEEAIDGTLVACNLTPAQAIAATLGSDDTFTREDVEGAFVSGYSLGLDMFDSSKPEKGWDQNERDMDEEMEDLGWVRKDAATLGAGTCRNAAPSYLDFLCSECGFVNYRNDENDSGGGNDWHYCPNCGRKVVDE